MALEVQPRPISYEEERGKPRPSRDHGRVQTNLIVEFFQQQRFSTYSELTLTIGGANFTPDIGIYPREAADYRHDEITRAELPLVAVEILSPSQNHQEVVEKAEVYLRHGVKSCWIVSPPLRTVTVLLPDGREEVFHLGVVMDPVVGLTADLTKVFS
jgi:Uma2 family endonuclease